MSRWTQADLDALKGKRQPQAKPRKYKNEPTMRGTFRFDSKREAERFDVLTDMLARGLISHFGIQPEFTLHAIGPDDVKVKVGHYIADFTYRAGGKTVFEDAKGMRTPLYIWKKKHAEIEYGVTIIEV